ncbi:MAG: aminotransferase class V-fold PLP-dependent enzyme [Lachnospirales bacterium]
MIYLDNSATTFPKPKEIIDAMTEFATNYVSPNRNSHTLGLNSSRKLYETRKIVGDFFGTNPLSVAFTSNATESLNLVIHSLFDENDHVIISPYEHNSVVRPLENIPYSVMTLKNLEIDYNFDDLIQENTKAIICTHSSNITGTILNLKKLSTLAKKHNLILILDVAQSGGLVPINMKKDNIDILCFTGHKYLYGISGVGGICVNGNFPFKAVKRGGSGSDSLLSHPTNMPDVFEAGTHNFVSIFTLGVAIKIISEETNILERENKIIEYIYDELKSVNNFIFYGNIQEDRTPLLSFNFSNKLPQDVGQMLNDENIAIRSGYICAPLIHKYLGSEKTGVCRISPSMFTTNDEVEHLVHRLKSRCTST